MKYKSYAFLYFKSPQDGKFYLFLLISIKLKELWRNLIIKELNQNQSDLCLFGIQYNYNK